MAPGVMQSVEMEGGWEGLKSVSLTANRGGVQMGVGLGGVVGGVVVGC